MLRDPFVLAALGVALGTAIGAALPRTELEDETLGAMGDELRTAAGETLTAGVEQATEAAERALDADQGGGWKGYLKLSLVTCPVAMMPALRRATRFAFTRSIARPVIASTVVLSMP